MQCLRTPAERFQGLPGWPWTPTFLEHEGLRMAVLDEGPRDAAVTALCLHGNPAWSYLYRHMIPVFLAAGMRVVAPDLVGFGQSDKPLDERDHTFEGHRNRLLWLVETLDLRNVMLVCQDWGGILGLTLPMAAPERYTRLLVMNTALATGALSEGFRQWRDYSNGQPDLAIGRLMRRGKPDLPEAEAAAYDAPFPDARHKAALRAFPNLVPEGDSAPGAALGREALAFWRERWTGESFMAVGMKDPVLGPPVMASLRRAIRGCPEPMELAEAGHFVQEWGRPIAEAALRRFGLASTGAPA
ncbi:MAG: haloalkane dehalogenase [Rubrivivax sp.]|jgi:pimeloyl-ACP methyl ester carboxylesterase